MNIFDKYPFSFYIGKDEQGVRDLIEYGELYKDHLLRISIDYQDINNLWDLVFALNEQLSLLIDIFEDELIEIEKLPEVLKITESFLKKEKDPIKMAAISKFLLAIKTAITYNSPLLIWW